PLRAPLITLAKEIFDIQRSLIQPHHAYVSRDPGRPRYVSRIENGIIAYRQYLFDVLMRPLGKIVQGRRPEEGDAEQ
ncbi:hypothetical protein ACC696_38920, partial [Rhizobium ruizarguesonis]